MVGVGALCVCNDATLADLEAASMTAGNAYCCNLGRGRNCRTRSITSCLWNRIRYAVSNAN